MSSRMFERAKEKQMSESAKSVGRSKGGAKLAPPSGKTTRAKKSAMPNVKRKPRVKPGQTRPPPKETDEYAGLTPRTTAAKKATKINVLGVLEKDVGEPSGRSGLGLPTSTRRSVDDKEVMMESVKNDGTALSYASKELREDVELLMAAVTQNPYALEYAGEKAKNNRDIVKQAIEHNGTAITFASEELQADRELALIAVKQNAAALEYVSSSLRGDEAFVDEVNALQNARAGHRRDPTLGESHRNFAAALIGPEEISKMKKQSKLLGKWVSSDDYTEVGINMQWNMYAEDKYDREIDSWNGVWREAGGKALMTVEKVNKKSVEDFPDDSYFHPFTIELHKVESAIVLSDIKFDGVKITKLAKWES